MSWLDELRKTQFAQHVLNPALWINSARRLTEAAEHLTGEIEQFWQSLDKKDPVSISVIVGSEYQNIFMMLYGFAAENLCKAYLVTQLNQTERQQVERGQLPNRLKSHALRYLVQKEIRLQIESDETELLQRLEAAVLWAGRYPVSTGLSPTDQREIKKQLNTMPQGIRGDDVPRTREIVDSIKTHVTGLLRL